MMQTFRRDNTEFRYTYNTTSRRHKLDSFSDQLLYDITNTIFSFQLTTHIFA